MGAPNSHGVFSLGANMETWKPVLGYEGLYEVSDLGRVRGLERTKNNRGAIQHVSGRIMQQRPNHKGYLTVHLSKNGVGARKPVHRIVAEAFIQNPDAKPQVNHISGVKTDNRATNLEWVTNSENMRHARLNNLVNYKPMLMAAHTPQARKKVADALKKPVLRSDGKRYASVKDAAKDIGVTHGAVSMNIHGKTRTCGGFVFSFEDGASLIKMARKG